MIFSPRILHCILQQQKSSERLLHAASEEALQALIEAASGVPGSKVKILTGVLSPDAGLAGLDLLLQSERLQYIYGDVTNEEVSALLKTFEVAIGHGLYDEAPIASQRLQKIANVLATIFKNVSSTKTDEDNDQSSAKHYAQELLRLLAKHAYYDIQPKTQFPPVSISVLPKRREIFRTRLSTCLTDVLSRSKHPALFIVPLIQEMDSMMNDPEKIAPILQVEGELQELLHESTKSMKRLQKVNATSNAPLQQSAALLISLTYLEVQNGDPDAFGMLDELNQHFSKQEIKRFSANRTGSVVPSSLVEIIISLVSKPSKLYRRLAQQALKTFVPQLDESGLQSMIKVLETKESLAGQAEIFDQEEDGSDEGGKESSSDISDSDVEEIEPANEIQSSNHETLEDESHEDEDQTADDDPELAEFNAKLAQALGTRPGTKDLDAEDSSSTASNMTDSQMEALDAQLSTVFRERKKVNTSTAKKDRKDAKENIANLKCRILELLEIFVKEMASQPITVILICPLLETIRTTSSALVRRKGSELMEEYFRLSKRKVKNGPIVPPRFSSADEALRMLRSIHDEALHGVSKVHATACSRASLLVVRELVQMDKSHFERVGQVYEETGRRGEGEEKEGSKVHESFFAGWTSWQEMWSKQK